MAVNRTSASGTASEAEFWAHPEWPHEIRRPFMLQQWESLTFLHWSFPASVIRPLLPAALHRAGVELDTFDGKAWVGLVPFLLTDLRLPGLPAFPWLGRFPETNVRTYLRGHDGKPAVWFFTLEADRLGAVLAARTGYGLPYRWAQMTVIHRRSQCGVSQPSQQAIRARRIASGG